MTEHIGSTISPQLRILRLPKVAIDGTRDLELSVYCPRERTCQSIDRCAACEYCEGFSFDCVGQDSFLSCNFHERSSWPGVSSTETPHDTPVSALMTDVVVCLKSDTSLEEAAKIFLERKIGGAPVVDDDQRPLGIVCNTDLIRDLHEWPRTEELDSLGCRSTSQHGPEFDFGFHAVPVSPHCVAEIMTPVIFTVRESTPVAQAAALMAFEHIHHVPVVGNDDRVVGIVGASDVVRWLAEVTGYLRRSLD